MRIRASRAGRTRWRYLTELARLQSAADDDELISSNASPHPPSPPGTTPQDDLTALASVYAPLFAQCAAPTYYAHPDWFRNLSETCLAAGEDAVVFSAREADGTTFAALPAKRHTASNLFPGARAISGLTNFYSCSFEALTRPGVDIARACRQLVDAMTTDASKPDVLQLDTLPREAPLFDALVAAIRARGWPSRPYFHFGNWFEDVAELSFDDYLARRPSRLRNTILRKQRQLAKAHDVRVDICQTPAELDTAMASYDAIYAASWKTAEPFPEFTPGLARHAAANGVLRLGICHLDGAPAAAQIWLTHEGRSTIFKLAYVERYRRLSLGTVLTARMMRHALEVDRVAEVDFGRGDDGYKQDWLSERRERWGILACNPRRFRGLAAAARHLLGPALKDLLRRHPR